MLTKDTQGDKKYIVSWPDAAAAQKWKQHLGVYSRTTQAEVEEKRAADAENAARLEAASAKLADAERKHREADEDRAALAARLQAEQAAAERSAAERAAEMSLELRGMEEVHSEALAEAEASRAAAEERVSTKHSAVACDTGELLSDRLLVVPGASDGGEGGAGAGQCNAQRAGAEAGRTEGRGCCEVGGQCRETSEEG